MSEKKLSEIQSKQCKTCKEVKYLHDFAKKYRGLGESKLELHCRACKAKRDKARAEYRRQFLADNRDKYRPIRKHEEYKKLPMEDARWV